MINRKILMTAFFVSLLTTNLFSGAITVNDLDDLDGNWHLRVMDGKEVRKARAILDFHSQQMILDGFDGCNRISGKIKAHGTSTFSAKLSKSRMGCRQNIHRYVSKRLHATIKEGFTITESTRYGIEGITLRSKHHDLFFKKMGGTGSIIDYIK